MGLDRRKFFKIASLGTVAGVAGKRSIDALAQERPHTAETAGEKRLAMVVDLTKCKSEEGCRDCINACHAAHNVPDFDNPKDAVKWIWTEPYEHTFPSQENEYMKEGFAHSDVLVLCNHCDNPPCCRVCPTQATWKREQDGIVMMDWHRCIGCRYCIAACPYGSRSFNWRDPRPFIEELNSEFPSRMRGVVEKCTFCEERLAKGQQPACVEACPENALIFGDLEDPQSAIREILRSRFSIRRKPGLGTQPQVYYIV